MLEQVFLKSVYPVKHLIAEHRITCLRKVFQHDVLQIVQSLVNVAVIFLELLYGLAFMTATIDQRLYIREHDILLIFEVPFHLGPVVGKELCHDLLLKLIAGLHHC